MVKPSISVVAEENLGHSSFNHCRDRLRLHHTFGRSGFLASFKVSCSNVSIPPNADPTMTPIFSGFSNVSGVSPCPASFRACLAAATAKCVYRSFDRTFLELVK